MYYGGCGPNMACSGIGWTWFHGVAFHILYPVGVTAHLLYSYVKPTPVHPKSRCGLGIPDSSMFKHSRIIHVLFRPMGIFLFVSYIPHASAAPMKEGTVISV